MKSKINVTRSCGKEYSRLKAFHYHRATCELPALSKTASRM